MRTMRYHLTNLVKMFAATPANDPYFDDYEERVERLKAKQKAMFDQMMADGTHLYAKKNYMRGDSNVLRQAGLVK